MKKLVLVLAMLAIFVFVSSEGIVGSGALTKDKNSNPIPVGRRMLMESNDVDALEHLDENTFATHANWDVTNDIVDAGGNATWTWADGDASTLTQVAADQDVQVRNAQTMQLTYTVAITTPIAGDPVDISVGTICAKTTLPQTAGTHNVAITTTSAGGNFVITIDPAAGTTAGVLVFDDIYLTSKYESPLTIPTATDVTLTIPDNAAELILNPDGTAIKLEIGSAYYSIDTKDVYPCIDHETITIANDSGGDATVYFYYNMLVELDQD